MNLIRYLRKTKDQEVLKALDEDLAFYEKKLDAINRIFLYSPYGCSLEPSINRYAYDDSMVKKAINEKHEVFYNEVSKKRNDLIDTINMLKGCDV